ncbi:MAG: ATP-binding cassette domain-containing protein, partial [Planctomycetales bacterium]|nr:ATP-binding cassette domain-containing protein [Planctomycetales bacterium]
MAEETRPGEPLIEVDHVHVRFGRQHVLRDIHLTIPRGQTLAIIGESGCGKSMTALALLRMVPNPPGRISGGRVLLEGEDLLQASRKRINSIRGKDISMIFQEP